MKMIENMIGDNAQVNLGEQNGIGALLKLSFTQN